MPHEPDLRASDADREATVAKLRAAALEGRLDADELEERLGRAYGARWSSELQQLTADVTVPIVFVQPESRRRVNPLSIVALVAGVFWFGWLGSIAAVVLGYVALGQIRRSRGTQIGRTAAVIGIALGYFGLALLLATILW